MMAAGSYLSLSLGDGVEATVRAGLFTPGTARWYALLVRPQTEDLAEIWLRQRGIYAFHPVLTRRSMRFGRVRVQVQRYLPGYVFAKVPGDPVRHRCVAGPYVTGALSRADGEWGILAPGQLRAIHAMRHVDQAAEERRRADMERKRLRRVIAAGDRVLFRAGLFAGRSSEVVELTGPGRARVRLTLFGREALIDAQTDEMVRLAV